MLFIPVIKESSGKWSQKFEDDPRVRLFIGHVRDDERLYRALNGVDYVLHVAAAGIVSTAEYKQFECVKTNVLDAIKLIDSFFY